MITIAPRPIVRLVVEGTKMAMVRTSRGVNTIRVVQTVSPVPTGGEPPDPGDLTVLFDNKLI